MTRDQIAGRIRQNLNDNGVTYYSLEDINESIQDAYDEIAVYCECIENETNLNIQGEITYYNLSMIIPDYYRIIRIHNFQTNYFLEIQDDREMLSYRDDWELMNSTNASEAIILGPQYLGLSGRQNITQGSVHIWYKAQANKLSGSSVPRINTNFQILLEHYSTADLLEQNQEFKKASIYWALYDAGIEKYRGKIQLLSKADRTFVRTPIIHGVEN